MFAENQFAENPFAENLFAGKTLDAVAAGGKTLDAVADGNLPWSVVTYRLHSAIRLLRH